MVILGTLSVAEATSAIILYFFNLDLGIISKDLLFVVAGGLMLLFSLGFVFREIRETEK